tara:strand:+ start:2110 stop:2547 length:438 start_codon:yes stop_codon:yes gene_type:complete
MARPIPESILSLDVGRKRVGLAGCDSLGITITPLDALHRKTFQEDLNKIKNICIKRNVKGLVIGVPLDESGKDTDQSNYSKRYGHRLAVALGLPLAWVNEHSSSWEAGQRFNLKSDRSGKLDSAAAALILEQWMNEGPELKTSAD